MRESLYVSLPLRELFENLTLAELAARVEEASSVSPADAWPIPRRQSTGPVPLSSAQARMWFLHQLDPGRGVYTITARVPLGGTIPAPAVQAALDVLVSRHESLRTVFVTIDGQPHQVVIPAVRVPLTSTDLAGLGDESRRAEEVAITRREAELPFDLETGPLLRAHLVGLGPGCQVLLLAVHHIVADGWSIGLIRRELHLLLQPGAAGMPGLWGEPAIQYPDYALWQRQRLASADLDRELSWWSEQLAGSPSLVDLPTDRPRPPAATFAGGLTGRRLPSRLAQRCEELGRSHGASAFMTYLAAFATLLQRWSGQDDIVIGTPVTGRTRIETESVVGLFVNSLPLRVQIDGDRRFSDLLSQVRDTVSHAQDHQDLPFEEIVRHVAPERHLGYSPLFQVMFTTVQDDASGGLDLDDDGAVPYSATAKFDLTMTVVEDAARPSVWLEYASDLFDESTVGHLLRCFERLLDSVTTEPGCRLSEVTLDDGDEGVLPPPTPATAFDGASCPCPPTVTPRLGGRLPFARPDDLAVTGDCGTLTHGQLDRAANRLANHLLAGGLRAGAVVAVSVAPGPQLVTAMLAVHRAGGAFLLLDRALPAARREALMSDCSAAVLLDADAVAAPAVAGGGDQPPAVEVGDDTPAYVVYTSGSTGAPKGVVVARRALRNHVGGIAEAYRLVPTDRVLQFAALGFDVAVEEILPTLASGAAVCFPAVCKGPLPFHELERLCGTGGVSVLNLPASYWHEWVSTLGRDRDVPDGLRLVVVGSEPVHPTAVARWQSVAGPGVRLLVAYGTSETTITNVLYEPAADRDWAAERRLPIGRSVRGCRLSVRDPARRPVPAGIVGELYIGGDCLASGYVGDGALTAELFLADPVAPGERIYRSGDLARRRLDGAVELLGRADDQIKLRGYRIEPAEVEAHLLRQPGVRAAAVVAREDRQGRMHLAAYLVPSAVGPGAGVPGAGVLDTEAVHAFLRLQLPPHLVPSTYTPVAALPRTASGKLDRRRLPDPRPPVTTDHRGAPTTPTEAALVRIWAGPRRRGRPGVHPSQLLRAGRRLDPQPPGGLADGAGGHPGHARRPLRASERGRAGRGHRPLPGDTAGRAGHPRPRPSLAHPALVLGARLARAVARQPGGRRPTRLLGDRGPRRRRAAGPGRSPRVAADGVPAPPGAWAAEVVPADEVAVAFRAHAAGGPGFDVVAADAQSGLDLEDGPLFRAELVADEHALRRDHPWRLLLVAHHLVVDVVSWNILLADLELALQQQLEGQTVDLPRPTSSFATWVTRLASWADGDKAANDVRWWLDDPDAHRAGRPPVDRPDARSPSGSPRTTAADEQVVQVWAAAPPLASGTRIEEVLVTALGVALAEWMGAPYPAIVRLDVEGHGREPAFDGVDVSGTVGWLTLTCPLTLPVDPNAPAAETLATVQDRIRSVPRKGLAHGAVRYLRDGADDLARRVRSLPAAEVSFNYLGRLRVGGQGTGLVLPGGPPPGPLRSPPAPRPYALDVVAARQDQSVVLWIAYAGVSYDRATIEALGHRCAEVVETLFGPTADVGASAAAAVGAYPLVPTQEAMLVHALSAEGSGLYVEHAVLELSDDTDPNCLREAWARCVDRHDVLRTRFVPGAGGRLMQEVQPSVTAPWRSTDWSHLGPSELDERIEGLLQEDSRRGFDLGRAPLMRFVLVGAAGGYRLVWSHHHALLDGWSAALLLQDVDTTYRALVSGTDPSLPPAHQFREYVEWLGRRDADGDEAYWRGTLAGFDTPTLESVPGVDGQAATGQAAERFAARELVIPDDLRHRVEERARAERVTVATVIAGAWALVLSANSGSTDVVFGMTVSGRPPDLPEAEAIVGLLIATHPVRARVDPGAEAGPWLADLAAAQSASHLHAHASLADVASWSEVRSPRPLFESLLVVENYPRRAARPARRPVLSARLADGVVEAAVREISNFPLNVVVAADLTLKVVFDTARFDPAWAASLLPQMRTVLEGLAEDGRQRLDELSVLTPADRRRIVEEWNDTARPIPAMTLDQLWAEAAATYGDRIAIDGPAPVTYKELDRAANRLAHDLLTRGCGPGISSA